MDTKILNTLTLECLGFIAQAQELSGAFLSASRSLSADMSERVYASPFFTGLIVHALSAVSADYRAVSSIQKRACTYLLSQQSELCSFNYWQRGSDMAREFPYPDDLDDTFSILSALVRVRPELCNGGTLAHIARLLIATETNAGGPYRTWLSTKLSTPSEELLPDIAVNANVAYFLKLQGLHVEPLLNYLHSQIQSGALVSRYYPSIWPVLYFLARSMPRTSYGVLISYIRKESPALDAAPDLLLYALRLLALVYVDASSDLVASAQNSLVTLMRYGRKVSPFCFDPVIIGSQYAAHSEALTRALALESLWLSNATYKPFSSVHKLSKQVGVVAPDFHTTVHAAVSKCIQSLPGQIAESAQEIHAALIRKDIHHEIALLPSWFAKKKIELHTPLGEVAVRLGAASVFGWMAYTIYDTIMDTAHGTKLLPVANTFLLELSCIYGDLLKSAPKGLDLFKTLIARMEAGNLWELSYARMQVLNGVFVLPEQDIPFLPMQPAEKSIGHSLAPLIFSFIQSDRPEVFDGAAILRFFEHYLTARQLNDDAHDWFEDICVGQLTMVNTMVLRGCGGKVPVDVIGQKLTMQRYFWNTVLPHIAQTITYHVTEARAALHVLHLPESFRIEKSLLNPLEKSARTALADSINAARFLKEYA